MPEFLTTEEVVEIHRRAIAKWGGSAEILDSKALDSALAQPRQAVGGSYLLRDLVEMAASYLFHLAANHAFADGNKRVALACALVFLERNGLPISKPDDRLYDLTLRVAQGGLKRPAIAAALRAILRAQNAGGEAPGA